MALGYLNTTITNRHEDGITFDIKDMHKASGATMQMSKYIAAVQRAIATINKNPLTYTDSDKTIHRIYWISKDSEHPDHTKVTVHLTDKIEQLFSMITGSYTQCLLKNLFLLKTPYAARIYELVMQYKPKYKRVPVITLDELRLLLGLVDEKKTRYKTYNELQRFVINPAIADINAQTDIELTFKPIRLARVVNAISFTYQFKSKQHEDEYIPKKKAAPAAVSVAALAATAKQTTAQLAEQFAADFAAKIA